MRCLQIRVEMRNFDRNEGGWRFDQILGGFFEIFFEFVN